MKKIICLLAMLIVFTMISYNVVADKQVHCAKITTDSHSICKRIPHTHNIIVQGGGGMSMKSLGFYLAGFDLYDKYDSFIAWLLPSILEPMEERLNERMDIIEARQLFIINNEPLTDEGIALQAALLKSKRTGENVIVGKWDCNGQCIKLS